MDKETVFRIVEGAAWLLSGIGGVIIILLSVIAYFVKRGHDQIEIRLTNHDNKFENHETKFEVQQKDIHELELQNRETLTILKHRLKIK